MKLILRRSQKSGMMGKVAFALEAKAEVSPEEADWVKKYKLGSQLLYSKGEIEDRGSGLLGVASRLAFHAMNIKVTVDDLINGKRLECKDIIEMLAVQEQLTEAATTFKQVLDAAATFGGEEVIEL